MSDPVTMAFSLNQKALDAAIAAELPRLIKESEIDYTSGRAPKGLTAQITLSEAQIRQAVTAYARRTVNTSFTHLSIQFQATRGEEGQMANITASTAPIAPEEDEAAPTARLATTPGTSATVAKAAAQSDSSVAAEAAVEAVTQKAEIINAEAETAGVADVVTDTGAEAPFEADTAATAPADATAEAAAVEAAKSAPVRSKLFGDLKRPDNAASE